MVLELLLLQALAEKAEEEEACVGRREEGGEDTVELNKEREKETKQRSCTHLLVAHARGPNEQARGVGVLRGEKLYNYVLLRTARAVYLESKVAALILNRGVV